MITSRGRTWAYLAAASLAFSLGACTISEPRPESTPVPSPDAVVTESDVISDPLDPNGPFDGELGTAVSIDQRER